MATVATSVALNAHGGGGPDSRGGNKTTTVYMLIHDGKYADVIRVLSEELQSSPRSRAALSLMGYAYYMLQDFQSAAETYEQLVRFHATDEYRIYQTQALFKAGRYEDASNIALTIEDPQYADRVHHLQASIHYEQDDLANTQRFVDQCLPEDPRTVVARGCIKFKEDDFDGARQEFVDAMNLMGYHADLAYNIALCYYKTGQYSPALKYIAEIIERGDRQHPELNVASAADGVEVRSVGNSQVLKETCLVEAFNLKAAIEFHMENLEAAKEALSDMPPRSEEELDPITLHNQALIHMDEGTSAGFAKLYFLLSSPPAPPETFGNLLLLYIKYQLFDVAADVLAQFIELYMPCLNQDLYDYLEAMILSQSSPEEAYRKFEILSQKHVDILRKKTKQIQNARLERNAEKVQGALREYDETLERYIPVLMAQAKIYWDLNHYAMVEKILKQSTEFCSEHDMWKLNLAHVFFMQDNKFREAIRYYEPIVHKHSGKFLDVTAIVLANLCVSYIMTSKNDLAEDLMRTIEKEEDQLSYADPSKQSYHLCIVNLVIGTLYCAKGNFEFGISRIMKSLEPYDKKLGVDTWYYAKRCFLALIDNLAKHFMDFEDEFYHEIFEFLDEVQKKGGSILTVVQQQDHKVNPAIHNVAYEARQIRCLFMKLRE